MLGRVTLERLRPLPVDGLVLYDIDDESDRNPEAPVPAPDESVSIRKVEIEASVRLAARLGAEPRR